MNIKKLNLKKKKIISLLIVEAAIQPKNICLRKNKQIILINSMIVGTIEV
jgi:hypothetical protein